MSTSLENPSVHKVLLADGRTLAYTTYGIPDSSTVLFYFHGFPSSRFEAALFHNAAVTHNIRLIAPDRPGMGQSTFKTKRRILDWSSDVTELADHLHLGPFGVLGISGGGPYVLACVKKIPSTRLKAAGIASGVYPSSFGLSGMLFEAKALLWVAPKMTRLVSAGIELGLGHAARDSEHPEKFEARLAQGFSNRPEADRLVWDNDEDGLRKTLILTTKEALRESSHGVALEASLLGSDWGFSLDDLKLPRGKLVIWHGVLDVNSPSAMAEKARTSIEGSELRLSSHEAHCSLIVRKRDEIMRTLKEIIDS